MYRNFVGTSLIENLERERERERERIKKELV